MQITMAQINPKIADFNCIWKEVKKSINEASIQKSTLIIFPEMSSIGYPAKDLLFKKHIIEKSKQLIEKVTNESLNHSELAIIIGGLKEEKRKRYNTAFFIHNGTILFEYAKSLLPNEDVFDEKRYFSNKINNPFFIFKKKKIAITICEEIWCKNPNDSPVLDPNFPHPDLIVNLSASPYFLNKEKWRVKRAKKIVLQNQCPLIFVNQVGGQDDLIFDGNSFVMNQNGTIISECKAFQQQLKHCSLSQIPKTTKKEKLEEEKLVDALVLGLKDYFYKTGFSKATLGLSGGIDSAVCYLLACKALGAQNVQALMLASPYTSKESIRDAKAMTQHQKQNLIEIPINESYLALCKALSSILDNNSISLAHENIQARIRGLMLMAYANHRHALLINTSNKSEIASGYSTLYGDLCGAISPIGDLTKKQVYQLAKHFNKEDHNDAIPDYIITRAPSAELRPNQKDQDSLPEYEIIDHTLNCILQDKNHQRPELEKKLYQNEFKRQQAPIILKVSPIAFGSGWRYPIAAHYENN